MPSIMTLEGPRTRPSAIAVPGLGRIVCDQQGKCYRTRQRQQMHGQAALACAGCLGDAGTDAATDLAHFNNYLVHYMAQVAAVNKSAMWLGLIGGVAGVVAGALIGRRVSKRKHAKLGGAIGGGLGLGLGTYFASRSILMPDFVAPQTVAQQTLTKDLTF